MVNINHLFWRGLELDDFRPDSCCKKLRIFHSCDFNSINTLRLWYIAILFDSKSISYKILEQDLWASVYSTLIVEAKENPGREIFINCKIKSIIPTMRKDCSKVIWTAPKLNYLEIGEKYYD